MLRETKCYGVGILQTEIQISLFQRLSTAIDIYIFKLTRKRWIVFQRLIRTIGKHYQRKEAIT